MHLFSFALLAAASVSALDCSAKELANYDFKSIKGVYKGSLSANTPPSKSTYSWNLGICQDLDDSSECPLNSDLCGTTLIELDGKSYLSEVIGFNTNLKKTYVPFEDKNDKGVTVTYSEVNWGDSLVAATIQFICAAKGSEDENVLKVVSWSGLTFVGEMKTPAACAKGTKKPPKEKSPDNGESWGWFTWIFIFMVLFLSIYIIGGAWFQYHKGNSIDFQSALKEVLENFLDLLRGLPKFVKEIVEKVTGNSNRGEYSAV